MSTRPVPSRPAPPPPISKRSSSDSKLLDEGSDQSKPAPVAPIRPKRGPNRPTIIRAKTEYVEKQVKIDQRTSPPTPVSVKSKPAPAPVNSDVGKSKQTGGRLRKLDIQVVSARPMSEVGFRDAQISSVPPSITIPSTDTQQLSPSSSRKIKNSPKLLKKAPPPPKPAAPRAPAVIRPSSPDVRPTRQTVIEETDGRDETDAQKSHQEVEVKPVARSRPTIIRAVKQKSADEVNLTLSSTSNETSPTKSPPPARSKPTIIRPKKPEVTTRQNAPPNQLPVTSHTKHDPWNKIAKGEKVFQPLNESEHINPSPAPQQDTDFIEIDTQTTASVSIDERKSSTGVSPLEQTINRELVNIEPNSDAYTNSVTSSTVEVTSRAFPVEMRPKESSPAINRYSNPSSPVARRNSTPVSLPIAKKPILKTFSNSSDKTKENSPKSPPPIAQKPEIAAKPSRLSSRPSSTIEKRSSAASPADSNRPSPLIEKKQPVIEKIPSPIETKSLTSDENKTAPIEMKPLTVNERAIVNGESTNTEPKQEPNATDLSVPRPIPAKIELSEDNRLVDETEQTSPNEAASEQITNGISQTTNITEVQPMQTMKTQNIPETPAPLVTMRANNKPKPSRPKTSPAITPTTPVTTTLTLLTSPTDVQPLPPAVQASFTSSRTWSGRSQAPPPLPKTLPPLKKALPPSKPPPPLSPDFEQLPPVPVQATRSPEAPTVASPERGKEELYEALYDYDSGEPADLVFKAGDLIIVTEKMNADWMKGEVWMNEGRSGIFPVSFVRITSEKPIKQEPVVPSPTSSPPFTVQSLFDYTGAEGDLSFSEGEIITVIEVLGEWYKGTKVITGETGLFPSSFVESLEPSTVTSNSPPEEETTPVTTHSTNTQLATVLYDYSPASRDDLALISGQTVKILQVIDENWLIGEVGGNSGMFPSTFIQINQPDEGVTATNRTSTNTEQTTPQAEVKNKTGVSLYDFTGEHENDLSFTAGETITGIKEFDSDWLEGSIGFQRGIFPRNFIQFND